MDLNQIIPSSVLHWNYRGFTEFPLEKIRGDESEITDIYLKENLLTRLPSDIGRLSNLESLYISGNDIAELPSEISKLRCLKCLDVSGNRLRRIPDEIGDVKGLKFLLLDENELRELPLRIAELRCLRYLSNVIVNNYRLLRIFATCCRSLRGTGIWVTYFGPQREVINILRNRGGGHPDGLALRSLARVDLSHFTTGRLQPQDNKLRWLPQKPVYNYHHCEFRFWRNSDLKCLPYSLWYHMFRDQQTRSLNIGCLNISNYCPTNTNCKLKLTQDSKEWEFYIGLPHQNILSDTQNSPPTLYEISKRVFHRMLCKAAEELNKRPFSIYSDHKMQENICKIQHNFGGINIGSENNNNLDVNGNCEDIQSDFRYKNIARNIYNVPADILENYYDFIPSFIRRDLGIGPISECENVNCKKPVFDFAFYEFCFGKLTLIDSRKEVVLSAAFCSKRCLNIWKSNKITIPWMTG